MSKRNSKTKRMAGVELLRREAAVVAANLRRIMERDGRSLVDVAAATGLDKRTVRAILRGANISHARTLHKLAHGLGVSVDELLQPERGWRQFDRGIGTLIDRIVAEHRESFAAWSGADFDELYDRSSAGQPLSEDRVLAAASEINTRRELRRRVNIVLESDVADLCIEIVKFLYARVMAQRLEANR